MASTHHPNIGIIGRKRTGKDTAAAHLVERYGYAAMGFADGVRRLAELIDPVIVPRISRTEPVRYAEALDVFGYEEAKDRFVEFRRVLQAIGNGVRDVVGPDVWVDALVQRVADEPRPVVVTDVRYLNEAERLRRLGFVLVHLTRPSVNDGDTHPSEAMTDVIGPTADYRHENEWSVDALYEYVDAIVASAA